jgi:hypothetical protein
MKYGTMIVLVTVAAALVFPAQAQYVPDGATGPGDSARSRDDGEPHFDKLPPDPEGQAEQLRLEGKCIRAIPIFRHLASLGEGYELARYNLGLCLFDLSKVEPDTQRAASLRQEAGENIVKAANEGLAKAQASLVVMYLDGTCVARDPVQAGMWALIYRANGARMAIGLPNISPALQDRLDGLLSPQDWQQAQSHAEAWTPHS